MKHFFGAFVFLFLLAGAASAWQGLVHSVADGDTLDVFAEGSAEALVRIRLYGIDAPEMGQAFGDASRRALLAMTPPGSVVDVVSFGTDKYGRTVALVIHDGETVNHSLIAEGLAWYSAKYCRAQMCRGWKRQEQGARKKRVGLWKDEHPLPPWEWRRQNPRK